MIAFEEVDRHIAKLQDICADFFSSP